MHPSLRHRIAEAYFRDLIAGGGIAPPDHVDYEPDSLVFRWSEAKLAVVLELGPSANFNGAG